MRERDAIESIRPRRGGADQTFATANPSFGGSEVGGPAYVGQSPDYVVTRRRGE